MTINELNQIRDSKADLIKVRRIVAEEAAKLAEQTGYRKQVLVCGGTGCQSSGSKKVLAALEEELKAQGIDKEILVVRTGCFGLCSLGPIMIVYPEQKGYLFLPAIMNAALCFISVPTKIVFYIDADNHFHRGTLGYLTYFIDGLYLLYLFFNVLKNSKNRREDYPLPLYLALTSSICLILPLFL